MKRLCLALLAAFCVIRAQAQEVAQEVVAVCHDYGCARESEVTFDRHQVDQLAVVLLLADSAADERQRLSLVVAQLYAWAGEQSPIWRDRAGNFLDDGMPGSMDCIDHSTTTTRFLAMLSELGVLRYHRVLAPQYRGRIFRHYAAVIEEIEVGLQHAEDDASGQFVVDSWFGDNGTPALVMPLEDWRNGGGPDV